MINELTFYKLVLKYENGSKMSINISIFADDRFTGTWCAFSKDNNQIAFDFKTGFKI
jgi:hypothetical protein